MNEKFSILHEVVGIEWNFERSYVNTEYWSAHINNPMLMTIFVLSIDWLQKVMSHVFNEKNCKSHHYHSVKFDTEC